MSAQAVDPFLIALRQAKLLESAEMSEILDWAGKSRADTQTIVAELLRRKWLTAYQAREVHRGRGAALTLGRYILLDPIGEGGMGRVFKARDTRLGREVALKVIRKEKLTRPNMLQRFLVEQQTAGKLSHPNVVLALDAGEVSGTHFIAMEFVEGIDLARLVQARSRLAIPQACDYVRQAAVGLQHAADQGLVHRDVKPSNLLVTPRGQVKVLDLGLAILKGETAGQATQPGFVLGTPDYLAPEQAQNPLGVDSRADVYALGATLFYLLTGRPPFDGPAPADKIAQHVSAPPPSVLAFRPEVPPQLDALVRWMMAKNPADRPQTPTLAALELAPFCVAPGQPVAVPEPSVTPATVPESQSPRRVRQRTSGGIWIKLVLLALVGLLGLAAIAGVTFVFFKGSGQNSVSTDSTEFTNSVGMKLIRLPGGPFRMGSPDDEPGRQAEEQPAAEATAPGPFFIAAYEVTQGQFMAVMGKSPARYPPKMRNPSVVPVDSVTWVEANEFCRRLTAKEKHRDWAYRLLSEVEWEYACRAGTETSFWSGDKLGLGTQGIFQGEPDADGKRMEKNTPYPVGSTEANPFGLFDMHGNVWEWCADATSRGQRIARGGSWREPAEHCRSATRRRLDPAAREADVGFRVVYAPVK